MSKQIRYNITSLFRKWALIFSGSLLVGIGVIGIFVPLLPTTPFLLLAVACYLRSSKKLYHWLINHRWFGNYIKYYREYGAITIRAKLTKLLLLWSVMLFTAFVIADKSWLKLLLGIITIGVSVHILSLKTLTQEMKNHYKINSGNK